jgi:serine/threonine protein phosphatase PrpC
MKIAVVQKDGRGRPSEDRAVVSVPVIAIFDGHGGKQIADALATRFADHVKAAIAVVHDTPTDIHPALTRTFLEFDAELKKSVRGQSGATATVVVLTPKWIHIAYLGDSPCFLVDLETGRLTRKIKKHDPIHPEEVARIQAAGGWVETPVDGDGDVPRVDGVLAIPRAFGDFEFKVHPASNHSDQSAMKVTAHPTIESWERPAKGILALMSDGLVEPPPSRLTFFREEEIAEDISTAMKAAAGDLQRAAELVVKNHAERYHSADRGASSYKGDDLSLILVDMEAGAENPTGGGVRGAFRWLRQTLKRRPGAASGHRRRGGHTGKRKRRSPKN